ncbi:MAG: hypothetical protein JWM80_2756 [Cyanobacteria bacterium RYN_339]|nr:hypothetical protein [Cyanobacteria bacterium RYN_339]
MSDERFKQLAAYVKAEDWDQLVNFTAERILRRLAGAGLFDTAQPEQLKQAHDLVGTALVDFVNVALTCVAEGELST